MKTFFANKINYLILLALLASVGAVGFLGYEFFLSEKDVIVPDFLGKNKEEVFEWCGQLDEKYACDIVYEGSRSVEKDIVFQQSINAGSKLNDKIMITISSQLIKPAALPQLYEAQRSTIETWAADNGIANVSFVEEFSDTVNRGIVIRMEPTDSIYQDTPVTVYISKGKENAANDPIQVKYGEYSNLTVAAFESQVKGLGLVPNHKTSKDSYSSSVNKGNIVWHGSGTYTYGETINYGICTEESKSSGDIVVSKGAYVGYTEDNFKTKATELGLKANHNTAKDDYSDSIAKGSIVWHGSGTYEKNETFNYGLSLGKKDGSSSDIVVKAGSYVGYTEENFKKKAEELGLKANHNAEKDGYSDSIAKGSIVWHGSGTYVKNENFNYGLSLGKKDAPKTVTVSAGTYVGKSEEEIQKAAVTLGLVPVHKTAHDAYSDTVAKGKVVWHGSGTYNTNDSSDPFNYGLSLGKSDGSSSQAGDDQIVVKSGAYIGYTEDNFKKKAEELGLKPTHLSSRDDYSDSIAKGSIVTHGYGVYEKGEAFNYGLSLGKKDVPKTVTVSAGTYVGKSEEELQKAAVALGLVPVHKTAHDAYSDTVAKGKVVWHGSGTYNTNDSSDPFNYGLSLGKSDGSSSQAGDDQIVVTNGAYIGYTEDNFKKKAEELGLKPTHLTSRDDYSDTVAKGSIVTHGYGVYEKGEAFNYGLSLGKKTDSSIYVSSGAYIGKSESEFKTIGKNLGLNPNHSSARDAYSDTVAKGYIVWHGSGTYTKGETFNYGLSLGKSESKVTVSDKSGTSESSFKSYIEGLGLVLGNRSTAYSDSIKEGYLISNDTGSFTLGSKVNYKVSLGKQAEATGTIMRPEKYAVGDTYEATKAKMESYLSVFYKVEYYGVTSDKGVGRLEKIEVGEAGSSYTAGSYPVSTPIKVYIVNKQSN
ncbi:MAG: hypothetical protein K5648_08385 [Erysipelotrichaceae bacterium]|nr:hypothetical protein [Erysipelotrichaceae bacterium]